MLTLILCDRSLATYGLFEEPIKRLSLHGHKHVLCSISDGSREEVFMLKEGEKRPQPMITQPLLDEPEVQNISSKVYIWGVGRSGIEMAHKTALRYPDKVAGVLLCPDDTGFEGIDIPVEIVGGDENLALLQTVQPGLQPNEESSIPYTVVGLVSKDTRSSVVDFAATQGRKTELGLQTVHHWFDGDLESLILHPKFPGLVMEAVDEAMMLAR